MTYESQTSVEKKSGPDIWKIVAIILVALVVFMLVLLIGRALLGDSGVSGPEVIPPPPDTSGPYAVANTYINVRSGPGTNYPSYGVVPPGAQAPLAGISPDGGWWQFQVSTETIPSGTAWASADFVTAYNTQNIPVVQPPDPPPTVLPPTPEAGAPSVTAKEAINVRSGPGTDYPSYGVAPKGMTLAATGVSPDGGWYQVQIPTQFAESGLGWVSAEWVQASNTENLPEVEPPTQ